MITDVPTTDVLGLPTVLVGGAGVVMGTAALLSSRAAVRSDLPATRWSRSLPPTVTAMVARRGVLLAIRILILSAMAGVVGALAVTRSPVNGRIAVAVIVGAALIGGPLIRLANPVRLVVGDDVGWDPPPSDASGANDGATVGWPAVAALAALSLLALTTTDGRLLAFALTAHVAVQAVLARRRQRGHSDLGHHDPAEALAAIIGPFALIGRDRGDGLVWRNPIVSAAHTALPPAALWLAAVVAGLALAAHATTPTVPTFVLAVVGVSALMRLAIIRPYFTGAVAPVAAAYGLLAAGRWLPPLDLLVFVGLHAVAIAVLHRQAIARHDPRTARAVQFPPRTAVVVSVLAGLAVVAAG